MKVMQLMTLALTLLSSAAYACPNNFNEICSNDLVLYGNTLRTVEVVSDDGRVVLREDSQFYQSFTDTASVSLIVPSYQGYEAGRLVLFGNTIRKVEAVDNSGRIVLEEDSKYYRTFTDVNSVSKLYKCYDGVCRGDEVLYGNSIRTVEAVDHTGRVVLAEDDRYYQSFASRSEVSVTKHCTDTE